MLTPEQVEKEALLLVAAQRDRVPAALLSKRLPEADVADVYRIAGESVRQRLRTGDTIAGYKIGITSPVVQEMMEAQEPGFRVVLKSKVYLSGATLPGNEVFRPAVESELAFRLGERLEGPGVEADDVLAATTEIVPCNRGHRRTVRARRRPN
ncbi:2-keto-4-pentenoate hydratase [Streptomyces bobili]|uniref:2-keto-4-pentenoate hydratase n=1 Tax=Streptomyces bobili TaxID=67280 RepID=UPI003653BECB